MGEVGSCVHSTGTKISAYLFVSGRAVSGFGCFWSLCPIFLSWRLFIPDSVFVIKIPSECMKIGGHYVCAKEEFRERDSFGVNVGLCRV